MEQLQLDLTFDGPAMLRCEHRHYMPEVKRVWCERGHLWTACGLPFCGALAGCAYEVPDNSPGAMARRLAWIKEHGSEE
jgi:hypothetical protein